MHPNLSKQTGHPSCFLASRLRRGSRGVKRSQTLAEFAIILPMFLTLMCGVIDYGYLIGNANTMAMAAREAANTAARQTTDPLGRGLQAAVMAGKPRILLNSSLGGVVITRMIRGTSNYLLVEAPIAASCRSTGLLFGGNDALKNQSRILYSTGTWQSDKRRPPFPPDNVADEQVLFAVEVFYTNTFVTPIGDIYGALAPTILYDAAFF